MSSLKNSDKVLLSQILKPSEYYAVSWSKNLCLCLYFLKVISRFFFFSKKHDFMAVKLTASVMKPLLI